MLFNLRAGSFAEVGRLLKEGLGWIQVRVSLRKGGLGLDEGLVWAEGGLVSV